MIHMLTKRVAIAVVVATSILTATSSVRADIQIDYKTSGQFFKDVPQGSQSNTLITNNANGSATIVYYGSPNASLSNNLTVNFNPANISIFVQPDVPETSQDFGGFTVVDNLIPAALVGSTTGVDTGSVESNIALADFVLTLTQTEPSPGGTAVFPADISGKVVLRRVTPTSGNPSGRSLTTNSVILQFDTLGPFNIGPSTNGVTVAYSIDGQFVNNTTFIKLAASSGLGQTSTAGVTGTILATAVPEPGSVAMALSGLPVLGLVWLRRRKQQV